MTFYLCRHCGNIITHLHSSGVPVVCCGEKMGAIVPGTVDASLEKHVPVVAVEGNLVTVRVGSVDHPMVAEHFIDWVVLKTKQGAQYKTLGPGVDPAAVFALTEGDEAVTAYAWCNLHGLWASN